MDALVVSHCGWEARELGRRMGVSRGRAKSTGGGGGLDRRAVVETYKVKGDRHTDQHLLPGRSKVGPI